MNSTTILLIGICLITVGSYLLGKAVVSDEVVQICKTDKVITIDKETFYCSKVK